MEKTELPQTLKGSSETLSMIGKIEIDGIEIRVPEDKLPVIQKAVSDPVALELIRSGRFELSKYETSLVNWSHEFGRIRVSSVSDCFDLDTPSLATLKKYKGELKTVAALCSFIEEAYSFFNVTNTLNDIQLQMTAQLIATEYYFLTIADLRLCFFNAYKNKYGKLYNRLDGSIILDWLKQYTEERALEAQRIAEKRSSEEKSAPIDPEAAGRIREILGSVKPKKREKRIRFKSFDQFSETISPLQRVEISEAIKEGFALLGSCDYTEESFRIWRKNTIVYRVNKGEPLSDIIEGIKTGKL